MKKKKLTTHSLARSRIWVYHYDLPSPTKAAYQKLHPPTSHQPFLHFVNFQLNTLHSNYLRLVGITTRKKFFFLPFSHMLKNQDFSKNSFKFVNCSKKDVLLWKSRRVADCNSIISMVNLTLNSTFFLCCILFSYLYIAFLHLV